MSFSDPANVIWVSNLSEEVDDALLHELFTQVGDVVAVGVARDAVSGALTGGARIAFASAADARRAAGVLDGVALCGAPLGVRAGAPAGAHALWVGNAPPDARALERLFARFSPTGVELRRARAGEPYAVVTFTALANAEAAMEALNGAHLNGQQLVVRKKIEYSNADNR